jgi:hypothetical protein
MFLIEIAKYVGIIVCAQIWAPLRALNLPTIRNLRVEILTQREAHTDDQVIHKGSDGRETTFKVHPESPGLKTTFRIAHKYGAFQDHGWIILDHNTKTISSNGNSHWFDGEYGGSGDIGLYILGIPGLLIFSPLLMLNSLIWGLIQLATGMNRYTLSFYLSVRSQLDTATRSLLKQALKNFS